jgi:steroid delta-isomerase-like uncharacterized protein
MHNKLLADRVWWEDVWHEGDRRQIDELFTPGFVRHDSGGRELHGTEQNRQFISSLHAAFPDVHFTVEEQIAEGDKVVVRYRFQGTHRGAFQGRAPTHKRITDSGILIYRIADDRIAEQWTEYDLLSLLQQVGAL